MTESWGDLREGWVGEALGTCASVSSAIFSYQIWGLSFKSEQGSDLKGLKVQGTGCCQNDCHWLPRTWGRRTFLVCM